jgi:hypothetical protein
VSKLPGLRTQFPDPLWRHPSYGQVGSTSNPELYGNSRMPSGHSRRTTELGRVEWFLIRLSLFSATRHNQYNHCHTCTNMQNIVITWKANVETNNGKTPNIHSLIWDAADDKIKYCDSLTDPSHFRRNWWVPYLISRSGFRMSAARLFLQTLYAWS